MGKLSNLRMSIFYLQQSLRETDISKEKEDELLKALFIMNDADKLITENKNNKEDE